MATYKEIGQRLRKRRLDLKLTQAEVAEKIEKSSGYYSHLENGTREMGVQTLMRISAFFCLSIDYILTGTHADESKGGNPKIAQINFKLAHMSDDALDTLSDYIDFMNKHK